MPEKSEPNIQISRSGSQSIRPADILKSSVGRDQIREMARLHGSSSKGEQQDSSQESTKSDNTSAAAGGA